jgi:glycine betaine/proline transport system substrate-binding protein
MAFAAVLLAGPSPAQDDLTPVERRAAAGNTIRIGWSASASNEATAQLAAAVLRRRLGYDIRLVLADTAFLYSALAAGKLDVMLGSWQPDAHATYLEAIENRVEDLGVLYDGARLGWVVPDTPASAGITSMNDLARADVRERLDGRIRGGEAGTAVMALSRRALEVYGLDGYRLEPSNDAGPSLTLKRAIARGETAVVVGRRPHWVFGVYDLRFLDDPASVLGGPQRVHVLARDGFAADHPWASAVLSRMWLALADVEALIASGRNRGYADAAERYLDASRARAEYWVHGRIR